jgi:quinoprotein glucose dehydrogenase
MKIFLFLVLSFLLLEGCRHSPGRGTDWPAYGGNKENNRYSALQQINAGNVKDLDVAWSYDLTDSTASGDPRHRRWGGRDIQCQPIVVGGVLYGVDARLKLFALGAASGKQLWLFDPFKGEMPRLTQCRGVTYWEQGNDKRIFYVAGSELFAVNALTGAPVAGFGANGKVSFTTGLDINHDVRNLYVTATSPGVIYKNTLIFGNTVSESGDAAPGYVRGFDAVTGRLIWTFHTIPQPGEPGYETWPKDAYKWAGGTNNWSGLALDDKRGAVYFGTGSPSSDFYGGDRPGMNLFSDCVVALDAGTGKLKWYYQTIHHDLWDRDIPCPPNLVTIKQEGKLVDVVVQVTKDGNVFVLDRDSGRSVFPVEERPVAVNGLPGEHPWPVQNFPVNPEPLCKQLITDSDITDLSPEAHAYVQRIFKKSDYGQKFIPPSTRGTILVGYSGGAEWGGNAIDSNGILYQNSNNAPWLLQMISMADRQKETAALSRGQGVYVTSCSPCHGADRKGNGLEIPGLQGIGNRLKRGEIAHILSAGQGRMPSFQQTLSERDRNSVIDFLMNAGRGGGRVAAEHNDGHDTGKAKRSDFPYIPPYISKVWEKLEDSSGYPGIKPPWGTLNAIDLNTGEYLWKVPLGEYPELAKKGVPTTGTESYGGPLATAGGLIFIAGTRDEKIRAFDRRTGKVVWEYQLPAGGFATPITYAIEGKQYIVIAAGGGRGLKTGGAYVAFALPGKKSAGFGPGGLGGPGFGPGGGGWGGWVLMGCFVLLALAFRRSPLLKGFSFTVLIFAAVSLALYYPQYFIKVGDYKLSRLILPLLQIIMFGMGTELSLKEFRDVLRMPKGIFIGVVCHYTIMPLVSFCIIHLFHFPGEIAAGIILVGCCPSGLASNVMSWLARANLALSVSVTTVSTLLAPFVTPLLMRLLAGELVTVHFWAMVWDITQIVILPIVAGLVFNYLVKGRVRWLDKAMPLVSMTGIAAIIVVITAAGRDSLLAVGLLLIVATLLQNVAGYTLGYWSGRLLGLEEKDCRTISLEVGMQNGGLASGIALTMGRLATVGLAPAVFGPMMNITGSSLATWWHRRVPGK